MAFEHRRQAVVAFLVCLALSGRVRAQTPGENVNMVSGTQWPGGDPFLQRQNEPSLAVSSRNPLHLLAGANDYRTVDLPAADNVPGELAGDAWLGLFKSFDGGQTWQSTLLPGYPQDSSAEGLASPLKAYRTAADPTVRAGTHGLFYYSGIAFNRGANQGGVFVATLLDQNNKENGNVAQGTDAIRYLRTVVVDAGTSGQFLDKPWLAVDIPRAGAATCTLPVSPAQSIPAGNVYLVWSRFTGSTSTKIMFSRSQDCGETWSNPIKLSESNSVNQGTVVAVDPVSGAVYVAWRRFVASSEPDAILFAKSTDFGRTFAKAMQVATILPFDQVTSAGSFRTNALPTLAVSVDSANLSRIHVAWAARAVAGGDARIMLASSADGTTWTTPAAVDPVPVADDFGAAFARGHQFMPQLTFSGGKLMLLYYDQRLDHTAGLFYPRDPFKDVTDGRFYNEQREPRGELLTDPDKVFTPTLTDTGLTLRRHTVDLRVAQADPGSTPAFASERVSRYRFGTRGDETGNIAYLQQLQVNPPNLPLFQQGTVPFLGDYIDIAGQTFLAPESPGGAWRFNTASTQAPVHYATWTSNQDVRPPLDGDWTHYTPVGGGGPSVFDPTQTTPSCLPGQEGMRNQNIYASRITQGLLVSSPQNAKPLSPTLERAFVVLVQNATRFDRTFRLTVASQPPGGTASFAPAASETACPFPSALPTPCTALDVQIAAHSSIARSVFVTSSSPAARITIDVEEVSGPGGSPIAGGLSSFVTLNPEGSLTTLAQPDGTSDDISVLEVYNPFISSANVANANVANANVANANVANANVANANIANAHIANPDLADANVANANVANANIANANIANANIANTSLSDAPVSDATFTVTNTGNTTHSYHVKLVGNPPAPEVSLQLILNKTYQTPLGLNCSLQQEPQNVLVANIIDPEVSLPDQTFDPNILDPRISNATLTLAPGESAAVTLRGSVDVAAMRRMANQAWPRIIAHAGNGTPYADPLVVTSESGSLPAGVVGVPYNATLQANGGKPLYTWSLSAGSLPPDLQLAAGGSISGTPQAVGQFNVQVQVTDSSTPTPQAATQELSVTVNPRPTMTTVEPAPGSVVVGQAVAVTAKVTDGGPGSASSPTGSIALDSSAGGDVLVPSANCGLSPSAADASSCSLTLTAADAGPRSLTAQYSGGSIHAASTGSVALTVSKAATSTTITGPAASVVGAPTTVTVAVAVIAPGTGVPAGSVAVSDGGGASCHAALSSGIGSCVLAWSAAGARTLTAVYSGNGNFNGSQGNATLVVSPANTTLVIGSVTPNPTTVGQPVSVAWGVAVIAPGSGLPTGSVTVSDGSTSCTAAVGTGSCSLTPASAGTSTVIASYSGDGNFNASSAGASLAVNPGNTATTIGSVSPEPSVVGQPVAIGVSVAAAAPSTGTPTGSVTIGDGAASCTATLSSGSGSCSLTWASAGAKPLTATYSGDANFTSSTAGASHQVNQAATTTTITSDSPDPSQTGQAVTVAFSVATTAPGSGTPTGSVTVSDGTASCTATLASGSGSCSLSFTTAGARTLSATYAGDLNFSGSSGTAPHQVNPAAYTFIGFLSPLATAGTASAPSFSGNFSLGRAVPIKWQLKDASGAYVPRLSSTTLLRAVFNGNAKGCKGSATGPSSITLYSPASGTTGGSDFRYDINGNQFVFNWDTSTGVATGPGCYTIVLQLDDGSAAKATWISLR